MKSLQDKMKQLQRKHFGVRNRFYPYTFFVVKCDPKITQQSSRASSRNVRLVLEEQRHDLSQRRERRVTYHQGTSGVVKKLERNCEYIFQHLVIGIFLKEIVTSKK